MRFFLLPFHNLTHIYGADIRSFSIKRGKMNKTVLKIIRVALLILALLNIVLASVGLSPIDLDSETLTNFINNGFAVVMALWSCWKNCSVTRPHLEADKVEIPAYRKTERPLSYPLKPGIRLRPLFRQGVFVGSQPYR